MQARAIAVLPPVIPAPLKEAHFQQLQKLNASPSLVERHLKIRGEVLKMALVVFKHLLSQIYHAVKNLSFAAFEMMRKESSPIYFQAALSHAEQIKYATAGLFATYAALVQPGQALAYYEWTKLVAPPATPSAVAGWKAITGPIQKTFTAVWSSPHRMSVLIAVSVAAIAGLIFYQSAGEAPVQSIDEPERGDPYLTKTSLGIGVGLTVGGALLYPGNRAPKAVITVKTTPSSKELKCIEDDEESEEPYLLKLLQQYGDLQRQMTSKDQWVTETFIQKVSTFMTQCSGILNLYDGDLATKGLSLLHRKIFYLFARMYCFARTCAYYDANGKLQFSDLKPADGDPYFDDSDKGRTGADESAKFQWRQYFNQHRNKLDEHYKTLKLVNPWPQQDIRALDSQTTLSNFVTFLRQPLDFDISQKVSTIKGEEKSKGSSDRSQVSPEAVTEESFAASHQKLEKSFDSLRRVIAPPGWTTDRSPEVSWGLPGHQAIVSQLMTQALEDIKLLYQELERRYGGDVEEIVEALCSLTPMLGGTTSYGVAYLSRSITMIYHLARNFYFDEGIPTLPARVYEPFYQMGTTQATWRQQYHAFCDLFAALDVRFKARLKEKNLAFDQWSTLAARQRYLSLAKWSTPDRKHSLMKFNGGFPDSGVKASFWAAKIQKRT